jgi:hypothetical protein
MVPPPVLRRLRADSPATAAAMLYAYMLSIGIERDMAADILQEALRKRGVGLVDRLLFRMAK